MLAMCSQFYTHLIVKKSLFGTIIIGTNFISSFSHSNINYSFKFNNTTVWKSIDSELWIRTWARSTVGAHKTMDRTYFITCLVDVSRKQSDQMFEEKAQISPKDDQKVATAVFA